ncbi:MAG: hypothetical protein FWF72_00205 [Paludibacter sp.]|nr:hypothetical protein [Paludibacter sp.]
MKKLIYITTIALLALFAKPAHAQNGFDFDNASNFYLIWLDAGIENYWEITSRIVGDYRLNGTYGTPNVGERFLDIWSAGETYTVNDPSGQGFFGQIGGYLDCSANSVGWAGGGFQLIQQPGSTSTINYTAITNNYRFHMAVRKTNPDACRINLYGGGNTSGVADEAQCAHFLVGAGDHVYNDPPQPNLTPAFTVNTWQIIDIPVSDLRNMGWDNRSAFKGYYISYDFGFTNGNNMQLDAIFYYNPSGAGVDNMQASNKLNVVVTDKTVSILNATAPVEVYNVAGMKVKTCEQPIFGTDEVSKGVYILKSGNAVAKVLIK